MIKTDIRVPVGYTREDLMHALMERLPLSSEEAATHVIVRRALNVKVKENIYYDMTVAVELSADREKSLLNMRKKTAPYQMPPLEIPAAHGFAHRPLVVGAGPAGLFCALTLAAAGARPIIIERGMPTDERISAVERFNLFGILDTESNVQFGEGGAGAFSDGKLKYGAPDEYKLFILDELIAAGGDPEIRYSTGAHLGTDKLRGIVKKIREKIISLGGEFMFSTRLDRLIVENERVVGAKLSKSVGEGREDLELYTDTVILAIGHSARDTFRALKSQGIRMSKRGFGIGLRVEHPREYINDLIYGKGYPRELGSASYHLVTHLKNGRGVYSFCMCPGGEVVAASGNEGCVVTNGMSEYLRNAENSNAAYLVSVSSDDFESDDALAGFALQEKIEKQAYRLTGKSYKAPAYRMDDFLHGNVTSAFGAVKPSYRRGVEIISPEEYLPEYVTDSLKAAMYDFDDWTSGILFGDAVMTGPETRTTSPVRIERNDRYEASLAGLYPIGEGGGYAGGIISSARDGVIVAVSIINEKNSKNTMG